MTGLENSVIGIRRIPSLTITAILMIAIPVLFFNWPHCNQTIEGRGPINRLMGADKTEKLNWCNVI